MIEHTTVKGLLQGKVDHVELAGIYIFRDGEHVLYVGRSTDVIHRLHAHMKHSSAVGDLIRENRPASFDWQIELMDVSDCMPFVRAIYSRYAEDESEIASIELAERAVIRTYHPCVNTSNNPDRLPLPAHIKWMYNEPLEVGLTDNLY